MNQRGMKLKVAALAMAAALGESLHRRLFRYMGRAGLVLGIEPVEEIKQLITKQDREFAEFRARHVGRLDVLERETRELTKKAGRPMVEGSGALAPELEEHRKAFGRFLRRGEDAGLKDLQSKAMNSQTDPNGGYLVLPEMDAEIDRVAETMGGLFAVANVRQIGTAKYEKLVKTSGMAARRIADGSAGGESTEPAYSKITIEAHTAEVEPWVNQETLDDEFSGLETDLANEAAIAFGELGGSEFISGDGVGKARGIASYTKVLNSAYAWGSVGYVVSGASGAFKTTSSSVNPADALVDMVHALKAKYRSGAVWLMNDATAGVVRKLKDNDARYVWTDSLVTGQPAMLLGYPVEIDDNMADIGAGSYSIAFGNFKRGYTIVNRQGTTVIRDPFTSKGVVKFNFRRRFGGGITNFEAIKLMRFATS